MKNIALAIAAALGVTNASAACPELDSLARRYGITVGGFLEPIPAAVRTPFSNGGTLLRLPLAYPLFVSDGFRHTVVFDTAARKAWILRTGGLAGVREWYGPVAVGEEKLENCRPEPEAVESGGIVLGKAPA